jgi:predicted O-methyltransferase YrrM
MDTLLQSILESKSVVTKDGINRPLGEGHIPEDEGNFLQKIIRDAKPRVSLEVGCAYGVSSLYICEALQQVGATKHIIIDVYQHAIFDNIGHLNLQRAGYGDLICFFEEFSYKTLTQLIERQVKIDFAFIDGQHTFDYVLVDFFLIDKLLKQGGIVVVDDLWLPAVRSVCRYILSNLRYKCIGPPSHTSALQKLASRISANTPLRRIIKPGITVPDGQLDLPNSRYAALQKLQDDLVGEGEGTTRDYKTHTPF